jgi:predicted solute-binding protein
VKERRLGYKREGERERIDHKVDLWEWWFRSETNMSSGRS